jgi:hypothetical protein
MKRAPDSPVTLRLKRETRLKVARIARRRRVSSSQVLREAIEALVERTEATVSPYESMMDLIGVVDGGDPTRSTDMGRKFGKLLKARRG